jgi:hypothetical protein
MKRVFLCSPYRGDRDRNSDYLAACMSDSLSRGEAPFAPHGLYSAFLDDENHDERMQGIACGLAWLKAADLVAVYDDFGVSQGMRAEILHAQQRGFTVEYRSAGAPWKAT